MALYSRSYEILAFGAGLFFLTGVLISFVGFDRVTGTTEILSPENVTTTTYTFEPLTAGNDSGVLALGLVCGVIGILGLLALFNSSW